MKLKRGGVMKRRFFRRNLLLFLAPLMVPVILLGSFSILTALDNAGEDFSRNNMNLLRQSKEAVELIFGELDSIRETFDSNYAIISSLKSILEDPSPELEQYRRLDIIKSFINAPVNSKSYIHSLYVYFPNEHGRFIASIDGLVNLEQFYDRDWFDSFLSQDDGREYWTEHRQVQRYAFQKKPTDLLSIYKRTYSSGSFSEGVIVINIYYSYIQSLLARLDTLPRQCLLVTDEGGDILFQNQQADYLTPLSLREITAHPEGSFVYTREGRAYKTSLLYASRDNHWKYISIIPQMDLLYVPNRLLQGTLLLLAASMLIGIFLANHFAKANYRQLSGIISIIESAQKGEELPPLPSRVRDEYGYIQQNILKTFLEQSYLKMQLSEKRYRMQSMELLALQSQINPHFLYNTLDTLNWISIRLNGHPNQISTLLESLSSILRYSLGHPNETATLAEEIANTRCYVTIQKVRYANQFDLFWEYDEDAGGLQLMKLLFQPLVENSLYHGIKVKKEGGLIKIRIHRCRDTLRIAVIDNGVGIPRERLAQLRQEMSEEGEYSAKIGLCSTAKRLSLFYGGRAGLRILSRPGLGTAVKMELPLHPPQDAQLPQPG